MPRFTVSVVVDGFDGHGLRQHRSLMMEVIADDEILASRLPQVDEMFLRLAEGMAHPDVIYRKVEILIGSVGPC